jgi:hypothetical protein
VPHLNRLIGLALVVLIGIVAAACGSSAASAGATSGGSTQPLATPTVAGTASASATVVPSEASDLVAMIPDKIGNITLQRQAMSGAEFVGSGGATQEAQDFLDSLGVSTDDVTVAVGIGVDAGSGSVFAELLFRAKGASSDQLLNLFKDAADRQQQQSPLEWQSVQLDGKTVEKTANPVQGTGTVYLYASGDLLAYITASDEQLAAEALSALP